LEKEGIINGANTNKKKNIVYEGENKEEAIKAKKNIKNLDPNKNLKVVNNKVVTINKRINKNDYRDKLINASVGVVKKLCKNDEVNNLSDRELSSYLTSEIYKELVIGRNFKPEKTVVLAPVKKFQRPIMPPKKVVKPSRFRMKEDTTTNDEDDDSYDDESDNN
jgi:hypothetical protein